MAHQRRIQKARRLDRKVRAFYSNKMSVIKRYTTADGQRFTLMLYAVASDRTGLFCEQWAEWEGHPAEYQQDDNLTLAEAKRLQWKPYTQNPQTLSIKRSFIMMLNLEDFGKYSYLGKCSACSSYEPLQEVANVRVEYETGTVVYSLCKEHCKGCNGQYDDDAEE